MKFEGLVEDTWEFRLNWHTKFTISPSHVKK